MKMKTSLLAIAALLPAFLVPGTAQAADYGLAPASYDWSGGYVGVNAGMGFDMSSIQTRYRYTGIGVPDYAQPDVLRGMNLDADASDSAFTGGVLAGYNWQMANFVLGLEGDFNYLGFNGRARQNADDTINGILTSATSNSYDTVDHQGNWYGTVRARLGYAFDNLLIYGTGGLAYGDVSINEKLSAENLSESIDWGIAQQDWRFGWTLGGGMEYGVDRWTLGLEYLYVDLGSYDWSSMGNASLASDRGAEEAEWNMVKQSGSMDYRFGVARASLKYRF